MKPVRLFFLIFLTTLFATQKANSQTRDNFIRLNKTFDGSSQVTEDSYGYIWITNKDGLYKYDGYNFTLFSYENFFGEKFSNQKFLIKTDPEKNIWLSSFNGDLIKIDDKNTHESFKDVLQKHKVLTRVSTMKNYDKTIWFGSRLGTVYKYNGKTETIDSITTLPKINKNQQSITSLVFTTKNEFWVSSFQGKVYNYQIDSSRLIELDGVHKSNHNNVLLTKDLYGKLWIATELQGLFSYDPIDKKLKPYNQTKKRGSENQYAMFISIFVDKKGIVWAGTDGDGLFRIDPKSESISVYKHNETNSFSISNNTIRHISEDSHGNKWIVTKKGLINILPNNDNKVDYNNGLPNNSPTRILCSYMASDKSLWIGTDGKGLNRVFPDGSKIHYSNQEKENSFFEGMYIQGLAEDAKGNMWIATYQNGLWVYNKDQKKFYKKILKEPQGLYSPDVRNVFKDKKNRIWASTITGIYVFDDIGKQIGSFWNGYNGLTGGISQAINQDENGIIWLGQDNAGLLKFNENHQNFSRSEFVNHNYYPDNDTNLYNHNINAIQPDNNGHLWILNVSGILTRYNIKAESSKIYSKNKYLKDIKVTSILLENANNLWLGSESGLHHYNVDADVLKTYHRTDGLQGNKFVLRSASKDYNGKLYFGGDNGLSSFYPKQLNREKGNPNIYINSVDILNKPAKEILGENLKGRIEKLETLNLNADQTSFAFQFSAIDNILNSNYHYAYKLNGFDNEWITPKKERIASYTNIPFGSYTFEVKAGSKKGVWDIPSKKITIHIAPPWWRSNLAYLFYSLILGGIVFAIIRWSQLRRKLAKKAWQNQKDKEIYALKMNFFAKMSHEIQTPLTLILGPIDDMLHRADSNGNSLLRQRLSILKNNAKRLSRIANELMTVRNKELGRLKVLASKKGLNFNFEIDKKLPDFLKGDQYRLKQVIGNLLNNAIAFTKKGKVSLKISLNHTRARKANLRIEVSDTGIGIKSEDIESVFERFTKIETSEKNKESTGLGLAIVKHLISEMHGNIKAESKFGKGSKFICNLNFKLSDYTEDLKKDLLNNQLSKRDKKYHILLLEDSDLIQLTVLKILATTKSFYLTVISKGEDLITNIIDNDVDVILLANTIQGFKAIDLATSVRSLSKEYKKTPIIVLSTEAFKTDIKHFKQHGINDVLTKPFDEKNLLDKIYKYIK